VSPPRRLRSPTVRADGRACKCVLAGWLEHSQDRNFALAKQADRRSPRRRRLVRHVHRSGARPVLEALLAVADGGDLDDVLAEFGRIPAEVYRLLGANGLDDELQLVVVDGGRQ